MRILDTSVAIDHLRGEEAATALIERLLEQEEEIVASELVRFELLAGVRENELEELEEFCTTLGWVPVTEEVARAAGRLARVYRESNGGMDDVDYLIAASALALNAELLTTNLRHFPMFEDLRPPY